MLMRGVGLVAAPAELSEQQRDDLKAWATGFLLCGGVISLPEWSMLLTCEREALLSAAESVRAMDAARLALALAGPEAAAKAIAPADGGAALDQRLCERACDVAAVRLRTAKVTA